MLRQPVVQNGCRLLTILRTIFQEMDVDELPRRTPWDGFPDVVICAAESAVKNHPDYPQAKQGNVQDAAPAATRLSASFLNAEAAQGVRGMVTEPTWLVPVHALEGQGFNRIPAAFAEVLARHFGVQVETSIIQINVVNHTGASGWQRMSAPPAVRRRNHRRTTIPAGR